MEVFDSDFSVYQDLLVLGLDVSLVLGNLWLHIGGSLSPSANQSERLGVRAAYLLISAQIGNGVLESNITRRRDALAHDLRRAVSRP